MVIYDFRKGYRIIRGMMAMLLLLRALALLGCGGGGGGNGDGLRAALATDLENQTFTFADGAAFGLTGETTTLAFRDFNTDGDGDPNTGPFTLDAAAGTATGTVTIGSCNLAFDNDTNTFDADTFPQLQPGETLRLDPCEVNTEDGILQVENASTAATSTSNAPTTIPTNDVAFVLARGDTGSYSVIDLQSRNTFPDLVPGGVHSDAIARFFNGRIYVVNRLGVDSIQIIDPQQGYTTPLGAELSVGNGANPHDIAFVSNEKAYVSRYNTAELFIINPTTLTQTGEIDLRPLLKPDDLDGAPEMDSLLLHEGLVYLTLQHLDTASSSPLAAGEVVVIDPTTDTIVTVIALNGSNPFSLLQFSPALNRILVSTVGSFGVNDGGIEAINPETQRVEPEFILAEATLDGEITHFEVVSAAKGFAVFSAFVGDQFLSTLVSFNPSTGERLNTLLEPTEAFIRHFASNSRNELYLTVSGDAAGTTGVKIFDTVQDMEVDQVLTNALPPIFVLFIEE
jgi:DNA-binding beta-propeller fold protein YncE